MNASAPLRIALDARIPANEWGGVQQFVQGLLSGVARAGTDTAFVLVCHDDSERWLEGYLGGNVTLQVVPRGTGRSVARRTYDAIARRSTKLAGAAATLARPAAGTLTQPVRSDGVLERLGVHAVHFLTPGAMLTDIPSIYQPHDLQHVHLPELFSPLRRQHRDTAYRAFSEQAAIVSVMTEWGREDIVRAFGLRQEKVAVVPLAPVTGAELRVVPPVQVPSLPERFVLYPAQTWPHKNHVRLLEALAILRDRGLRVPLVSTGRQNEGFGTIREAVERLGLGDQVQFLGYVDDAVLVSLYRRATALIFPSLFEGWGIPIVEAFSFGLPVAAADATVIPEVASGAALLFDPLSPGAIAHALERIVTDESLRAELRRRGTEVASRLDWKTTATTFDALYRKVLGRPLTADQRELLEPPTLVA